jgi:hypothetical protein
MDRRTDGGDFDPWRIGWTLLPGPEGPVVHRPDPHEATRGICGSLLDPHAPVHDSYDPVPPELDACSTCQTRHAQMQAEVWSAEHEQMRAREKRDQTRRARRITRDATMQVVPGGLPGLGRRR